MNGGTLSRAVAYIWESLRSRFSKNIAVAEFKEDMSDEEDEKARKLAEVLIDTLAPKSVFPVIKPEKKEGENAKTIAKNLEIATEQNGLDREKEARKHIVSVYKKDGYYRALVTTPLGLTDEHIMKLAPMIAPAMSLFKVDAKDLDRDMKQQGVVSMDLYYERPIPPLERLKAQSVTSSFFDEYPAKTPYSIPLAVDVTGDAWNYPLGHSMVIGRTGSGKGSVFQGIIRQLAPFTKQGLVKLYMIDPKMAEGVGYDQSTIFTKLAMRDTNAMIQVVNEFHADMFAAMGKGRSNVMSVDSPVHILMIDELAILVDDPTFIKSKDAEGITVGKKIDDIGRLGRAMDFYLIIAAQKATQAGVGPYGANMVTRISLRINTPYEIGVMLGDDKQLIEDRAINPIPPSTKSNHYATAGIANVVDENDVITPVRFVYTSDEDIETLIAQYPVLDIQPKTAVTMNLAEEYPLPLSSDKSMEAPILDTEPVNVAPVVIPNVVAAPVSTRNYAPLPALPPVL